MSKLKLTADGGGGTVAIKAPASTTGNAALELTVPGTANGNILTSTSGSSIQVLEQFYSPCDGSTMATAGGNIALTNVTTDQAMTTSFATLTGSQISYLPPTGTTQVIYTFEFVLTNDSSNEHDCIFSGKLKIDNSTIDDSRFTHRLGQSWSDTIITFRYGINIGGTSSTVTGRQASWTSAKTLTMEGSEYGGLPTKIHEVQNYGSSTPQFFRRPSVGITAIGVPS